jgi:hypothetical protein
MNKNITKYAKVEWTAGDVQTLRPNWSLKKCEEELNKIESDLHDRLVEKGWDVIENLLDA